MTEQKYKWTHIGDLYSFYSDRVLFLPDLPVNPDGESTGQRTSPTDAFHDMAIHMSGHPHQTYELPLIVKDAHDYLENSFPFLKEIAPITFAPDITFDDLIAELDIWLHDLGEQYGHWHKVLPLENYTPKSMYENARDLGLLDKAVILHTDRETGETSLTTYESHTLENGQKIHGPKNHIKGHDLNMN